MRHYFFPLMVLMSSFTCSDSSLENSKASASIPPSQANFECDYAKCKARSNILYKQFLTKTDPVNKQALLNNIRDSLLVCWYGTAWDFNGTTEEPGKGKIACGYFVTTILRDLGVPVKRYKHAQMASEEMINSICLRNNITTYANIDIPLLVEKMKVKEVGLYIVGLDFHTGFILHDGQDIYFVHSNYAGKKAVMSEIAVKSAVLAASRRWVIGKVI